MSEMLVQSGREAEGEGREPDAASSPAAPLRRSRQKPRRRSHRDLTPEEDNRLRQRQAILKIIPAILAVVGGVSWLSGMRNPDEYQWDRGLIRTGQVFVTFGLGFFSVLLFREWLAKFRDESKERRARNASGYEVEERRLRSRRRRHRSSKPSGVRAE